jgi:ABC-type spermidine/putrescine transport system permease subunit I
MTILAAPASPMRRLLSPERAYLFAALPLLVFLFVQFFWPVGLLLGKSVTEPRPGLQQFIRIFDQPAYLRIFLCTFKLAITLTVLTGVIAYPLAYYLSVVRARLRDLLLFLILVPFWTSILVRTYGWMVLLGRNGIINAVLLKVGLLDQPIQFLFNGFVVRVAMVQILLPFFVLPLYSTLRGIDGNLLQAASGLGAPPWRVFQRVYWPLSLPGLSAGAVIVFVLSFGFFITPALLGGRSDVTAAMLIFQQFDAVLDWGFGAALSTVLLAATLLILGVFTRFTKSEVVGARP